MHLTFGQQIEDANCILRHVLQFCLQELSNPAGHWGLGAPSSFYGFIDRSAKGFAPGCVVHVTPIGCLKGTCRKPSILGGFIQIPF